MNKSVPYFKQFQQNNDSSTINEYLFKTIQSLHMQDIDFVDKNYPIDGLDGFPDGTFTVREASEEKLSYKLQVNDNRYWQYHRNNGITKIGVINPENKETSYFLRTIEGQISIVDMIN